MDHTEIAKAADNVTGQAGCLSSSLPPSLIKAIGHPLDYVLRMRTGEVIYFDSARYEGGDYITLYPVTVIKIPRSRDESEVTHRFPHGLDVRISDIVLCAEEPDGCRCLQNHRKLTWPRRLLSKLAIA